MVVTTTPVLTWLGTAAARLLACCDEEGLVVTVDAEVRRGLGVDRVRLALTDERRGEWYWALSCDAGGRAYRDPRRYPLATFRDYLDVDRFADGAAVVYTPDLTSILTPLQQTQTDGPLRENLAVALRRVAVRQAGEDTGAAIETATHALGPAPSSPHRDIVGLLSVDNLPSGRPLVHDLDGAPLLDVLAVFGQILAQAIESVRLRHLESAARAAAERHAAREAALAELAGLVSASLRPMVVAQRTVATMRTIMEDIDQVWLWAVSDDHRHLKVLAVDGVPPDVVAPWSLLPLDAEQFVAARVVEQNRAEFLEDLDASYASLPAGSRAATHATGAACYAALPLSRVEGVVGVMAVIGQRPRPFPPEDRAFLQAVAGHVGTALSNARFVSQQRRATWRAHRLLDTARALSRLGRVEELVDRVARTASRVLDCDRCAVHLLDDTGTQYLLAACAGIPADVQAVLRTRRPQADLPLLRPLQAGEPMVLHAGAPPLDRAALYGMSAALLLPLRAEERTIGFLSVGDSQRRHHFTAEEIALGQGIAHHAATAVQTARLYAAEARGRAEAERRAAELSALVAGARLLIGAASPRELAEGGVHVAVTTLHADAGWVIACAEESAHGLRLEPLAWVGLPDDAVALHDSLPPQESIAGQAALRRTPVIISGPATIPIDMPAIRIAPDDLQAYLAVPMIVQDRLVGALAVGTRGRHVWIESEVALLQALANQMAAGLEAARLRAEAAHAEAAREADRLKDELLSTVSHELRTPLGSIKGFATALLEYETTIEPEERREFLRMINNASDRLRALVDDLLEVGRLEARGMRLTVAPVDMSALLRDTIRGMGVRLADHPVRLKTSGDVPLVSGDGGRLRQVLQNLLDNAAKYSPGGCPIAVTISAGDGEVQLRVADRGIGIPAEHLARIFERFHRVDSSLTRSVGGTGLGLFIARSIVEAHGGRIWAESAGENRGTTIVVTLPAAAVSAGCPEITLHRSLPQHYRSTCQGRG